MGKTWIVYVDRLTLHSKRVCRYMPKGVSEFYMNTRSHTLLLTARYKRGICVLAAWKRGNKYLGSESRVYEAEWPNMAIRKREVSKSDVQHLAAVETVLFHAHMPLIEHCALRKYEDGTDREPGWITLKVTGAAWVIQVKDPDSATSFSAVADTIDKALDTAALLLACDEAPWEPDIWLAQAKAKKSKK
jgi:hypothetical protein